jgi:hypothetical protein
MSYHYRDDKKREALLRELSQVDNDLNSKKKTLERLKLEEEVPLPLLSSMRRRTDLYTRTNCHSPIKS